MSHPKLFKPKPGLMPARGLLKWRDFIAAITALKSAGQIGVSGAKITETANGVVIQPPINRDAGSTPFDAVAGMTAAGLQTQITPGFLFAGTSFIAPTLRGRTILSPDPFRLSGAPKNIYLKVTWQPIIATDINYVFSGTWTSVGSVRIPQGINLISAEIVATEQDSPEDEGWTDPGESHVPAIIRTTENVDGSMSATVTQDGIHYERIAARNANWQQGDDITDIYLSSQAAPTGGYGHRAVEIVADHGETLISSGPPIVTDVGYILTVGGVSII